MHMILRSRLVFPGGMALLLWLAGCGQTEKSVAPPVGNPFEGARVGTDTTLEVMTWNIENFPKATTTVGWVRDIVQGLQPDIVAVEEIANGGSFNALMAQLPGWAGVHANSDQFQNLGFIYQVGSALEVTSAYEIYGSRDYSREFPRAPYVLEATWRGVPIVVIANHLKASGNGVLDPSDPYDEETRRRDACVLLADYVQTQLAGQRVFIVGDMNDELTDNPPNNVFQNFLDDPTEWRFADMTIAQGPSSGWSYPGWPSHLDHILVTSAVFPDLDKSSAYTAVVSVPSVMPGGWSRYNNEVSDHLPVVVRLQP